MNRRLFVRTGAALVASGAGVFGYATMVEPHWLEFVQRDLPIADLPPELAGAKLAHVSDIHTCTMVDEHYLIQSLERLKAFSPDIMVYTGDYVTWSDGRPAHRQLEDVARVLSHAPLGRLATIGILGNHDYGSGTWDDVIIADKMVKTVATRGIEMLRNDVKTVAGLDIIGLDDLWAHRCNPQVGLRKRTSNAAIVLCHNPDALDELNWNGYSGWVLAGHTHGGQCKAPFLPPPLLPVRNHRYTSGEIVVNAERKLYISRGVGHLLKIRFNVRPEMTIFTLRAA